MTTSTVVNEKRGMAFFVVSCVGFFICLYFLNRDIARVGFYLLAIAGLFLIYRDGFKDCSKGIALKACLLFVFFMLIALFLSNLCCSGTDYYSKPFIHMMVLVPFILLNVFLSGWMKWLLNVSIFYVVVCIFSYALSDYPLHSAKYFESHYALYLLTAPVAYTAFKSHLQTRTLLIVFVISGLVIGFGAIADLTGFARSQFWYFDEYPVQPNLDTWGIGLGMNSIHFGIVTAALLAMVVVSLGMTATRMNKFEITLSIISMVFLCFALAMSGARSAWISLPFIFIIPFVLSPWLTRYKISFFVLLVFGLVLVLQSSYVQKRLLLVTEEIAEYMNSTDVTDSVRHSTSIGLRFELWRAAWEVFLSNPVIGAGPGNFRSNMQELSLGATGKYHEDIEIHKNPHSLYLKALAERGALGLVSSLLILILPGILFLKYIGRSHSKDVQAIATSGVLVVIVFSLGGLTIGSLHKTELSIFYITFVAVFFGTLLSNKENA